jgi:NTP pyrophosphatase (non-canonical NTP hydrolase)
MTPAGPRPATPPDRITMTLAEATDLARRVRDLYHQLETAHEGSSWSVKDDTLGLVNDVGTVARLVMASEGRWSPGGDVPEQLAGKLAECLWWILILADRLDVDITTAFDKTLHGIESHLNASVERLSGE